MPAGPAGKATLGFTVSYSMGVDSPEQGRRAGSLISYLTGPEGMKTWTEGGVANPSRSDVAGAPGKEILVEGAEYAKPWSFIPGFSEINDAFNNAMTGAIEGTRHRRQDVATATKDAIDSNLAVGPHARGGGRAPAAALTHSEEDAMAVATARRRHGRRPARRSAAARRSPATR